MARLWYSLQSGKSLKLPEDVEKIEATYHEKVCKLMERENVGKLELLMKKLRGD